MRMSVDILVSWAKVVKKLDPTNPCGIVLGAWCKIFPFCFGSAGREWDGGWRVPVMGKIITEII